MTLIIELVLFTLYAIAEGQEDGVDTDINHRRGLWPRIFVGAIVVVMKFGLWPPTWCHAAMALLMAAWFWLVFELSRNITAGDHPLYIGHTADTDRWLRRHNITEAKLLCIKIVMIITGLFGLYHPEILNWFK